MYDFSFNTIFNVIFNKCDQFGIFINFNKFSSSDVNDFIEFTASVSPINTTNLIKISFRIKNNTHCIYIIYIIIFYILLYNEIVQKKEM